MWVKWSNFQFQQSVFKHVSPQSKCPKRAMLVNKAEADLCFIGYLSIQNSQEYSKRISDFLLHFKTLNFSYSTFICPRCFTRFSKWWQAKQTQKPRVWSPFAAESYNNRLSIRCLPFKLAHMTIQKITMLNKALHWWAVNAVKVFFSCVLASKNIFLRIRIHG